MADSKIPAEYRNPAAVYRIPATQQQIEVAYNGSTCRTSADAKNPGFSCGNTFLKVHGYGNFLLVPSGRTEGPLLFSEIDAKGSRKPLSSPKKEILMSPIESDSVDVHGGDKDCR